VCRLAADALPLPGTIVLGALAAVAVLQLTGELRPAEIRAVLGAVAPAPASALGEARG
jgi:hypothetical protein